MRKIIATILSATLILNTLSMSVLAYDNGTSDIVIETNKLLGIINGDKNGNLNLHTPVTRAEFSKMMVSASIHSDISSSARYSLFSDVNAHHWASGYIKTSVEQGWFLGYADGTFKPDSYITLETGATAVLRMLGYTNLEGSYPSAQLSKFYELNLDEGISATLGQNLSRGDCANLFYNLMSAKTSSGVVYAQTIGYPISPSGTLDTLKLTSMFTDGPYIYTSSGSLPFKITSDTLIYKNNKLIEHNQITLNDVCYYNEEVNTVWVYDDSVTGRITLVDSVVAPSKITVSGITYSLETQDVSRKLTAGGQYNEGDLVTLLLGENGMVVDILDPSDHSNEINGLVLSEGLLQYDDFTDEVITIVSTDGTVQTHSNNGSNYENGDLVTIKFTENGQRISKLSEKSISGKVSTNGDKIGSYKFADDVQILEVSGSEYGVCYPSRLAGYDLKGDDVIYYSLNDDDEIEQMIIEDVTGDLDTYGLITDAFTAPNNSHSTYNYILNGNPNVHNLPNGSHNVNFGGSKFKFENGQISSIQNLKKTTIKEIYGITADCTDGKFDIASDVQVYERVSDSYFLVSKDSVLDPENYSLSAYYDYLGYSAGEQIRIIVADAK